MPNPTTAADADLFGDATLTFGLQSTIITLIQGMAVTELKPDAEVQWNTQAEGPTADVIGMAVSKKKKYNVTGSGYLLDSALFYACKNFTFNGVFYVITKWGNAFVARDYAKADFTAMAYDGITGGSGGSGS